MNKKSDNNNYNKNKILQCFSKFTESYFSGSFIERFTFFCLEGDATGSTDAVRADPTGAVRADWTGADFVRVVAICFTSLMESATEPFRPRRGGRAGFSGVLELHGS